MTLDEIDNLCRTKLVTSDFHFAADSFRIQQIRRMKILSIIIRIVYFTEMSTYNLQSIFVKKIMK